MCVDNSSFDRFCSSTKVLQAGGVDPCVLDLANVISISSTQINMEFNWVKWKYYYQMF